MFKKRLGKKRQAIEIVEREPGEDGQANAA